MKLVYAFRNTFYYPYGEPGRSLPPPELRKDYLSEVREMGFKGVELSLRCLGGLETNRESVEAIRRDLEDAALPCVALRLPNAPLHIPHIAKITRLLLGKGIEVATWLGAEIFDFTLTPSPSGQRAADGRVTPAPRESSRDASEADYEVNARGLAEIADRAAETGIKLAIEVHNDSIIDNSRSALRLLERIDRPNVGVNPDLKNMLVAHEVAEETWMEMIHALAPHTVYWHMKNISRMRPITDGPGMILICALPDGDINYRYAIAAMKNAGFAGFAAVEGLISGDALYVDGRSAAYALAEIAR